MTTYTTYTPSGSWATATSLRQARRDARAAQNLGLTIVGLFARRGEIEVDVLALDAGGLEPMRGADVRQALRMAGAIA